MAGIGEVAEAGIEEAKHAVAAVLTHGEKLLADRTIEHAVNVGEIGEQEGQSHDVQPWIDRIHDAAEADIDRAGADALGNRPLIAKLAVGEVLHHQRTVGALGQRVGEVMHGLVDQTALAAGVGQAEGCGGAGWFG